MRIFFNVMISGLIAIMSVGQAAATADPQQLSQTQLDSLGAKISIAAAGNEPALQSYCADCIQDLCSRNVFFAGSCAKFCGGCNRSPLTAIEATITQSLQNLNSACCSGASYLNRFDPVDLPNFFAFHQTHCPPNACAYR